ncbi:MAG: CBS domain-containing protein [Candidatus Velthaea sp.]|jgi:CBS domain-containing protein
MRVSDLPISPLLSVEPEATLADVARRMRLEDCGSAAVMSGNRLLGIITERDLVQAIADGIDPRKTTAGLTMSADPMTVSPDDDVAVVAMRMIALGIRHLPVLEANGNPIGMLSARTLTAALESPRNAAAKDAN